MSRDSLPRGIHGDLRRKKLGPCTLALCPHEIWMSHCIQACNPSGKTDSRFRSALPPCSSPVSALAISLLMGMLVFLQEVSVSRPLWSAPCSVHNCKQDFRKLEQRVKWILLNGFYNGSKDENVLYDLMSQEGQLQDLCNQSSWSRPLLWSLIQLFQIKFLSFIIRIGACGLLRRLSQWAGHVSWMCLCDPKCRLLATVYAAAQTVLSKCLWTPRHLPSLSLLPCYWNLRIKCCREHS